MTPQFRKRLNHDSPNWVPAESEYFITVCSEPRKHNQFCHPTVGPLVLDSIRHYNDAQKWFCDLAVLMPDHVHLLLSTSPDKTLAQVVGWWKRWLTRKHAIVWQANFFDHRLRNDENIIQKAEYVLQNPVRAGFVKRPEDWPYVWMLT